MFLKISRQRGLAALCFLALSFGASPAWAQTQETSPQDNSQNTAEAAEVTADAVASAQPSTPPSTLSTQNKTPSARPTPPISVSAIPEGQMLTPPGAIPTARGLLPQDPNATPAPVENTEAADNTGSSADIPPDPNVMDSAVNTPIYTRPLAEAPTPLDAPVDANDNEHSPYGPLSIMLWSCFLAAAAATSYFLYVRFGDSRA